MTWFQNKYLVESTRLDDWDYSSSGYYFVTICSHGWKRLFGIIENHRMILNNNGRILLEEWEKTLVIRRELEPDAFQIMPNHFHAIVRIVDIGSQAINVSRGVTGHVSANIQKNRGNISPKPCSLAAVIRAYKSAVTLRIHTFGFKGDVWQSRSYDHIIRDGQELLAIRQYIQDNPAN